MDGVAVKDTETPAQAGFVPVVWAMVTAGVTGPLTVMLIEFEVAGFPVTPVRFEVITQDTTSPLARVELVYEEALVPTFTPFTLH